MSASLGLFRLQQIDRQIDRARARLDAIQQTLQNDSELRGAAEQSRAAQEAHFHAAGEQKNITAEAGALKIKIQQAEASLYGGKVKNPKELQDLEREIASLKKHLTTLEERELESMLALEERENELQSANANLEIVQARKNNEHKNLIEEQNALQIELEKFTEERSAALAPIDPALAEMYETLRKDKRGIAVAEVTENACSACGANINAALTQNARSAKLAYCPSCGRILYAK